MARKYFTDNDLHENIENIDEYEISDEDCDTGYKVKEQIEISDELEMESFFEIETYFESETFSISKSGFQWRSHANPAIR